MLINGHDPLVWSSWWIQDPPEKLQEDKHELTNLSQLGNANAVTDNDLQLIYKALVNVSLTTNEAILYNINYYFL